MEEKGIVEFPKFFNLTIESGCNLKCPICRDKLEVISGDKEKLDVIYKKLVPIVNRIEFITAAYGEFFINKNKMDLLRSISNPNLKFITLFTNSIAITPAAWNSLPILHNRAQLSISIDAATKETYEFNRPPAKWETLIEKLDFLQEEKKSKNFQTAHVFVIQKNNYKEIPLFIEMAKKYDAKVVWHLPLYWGHSAAYSKEDYKNLVEVHHPDHPEFNDLLKVFEENDIKAPDDLEGCGHWYL